MVDQTVTRRVDVDINVNSHGSEKAIADLARLVSAQARLERSLRASSNGMAQGATSAGQMRAGMQNLGFQFQDIAVQIAGGQGAMRAFAQQLPQAIGAVQVMFSSTSKLGAFLGGPWGVAFGVATAVLIPLIGYLFSADDATKQLTQSASKLSDIHDKAQGIVTKLKDEYAKYTVELQQAAVAALYLARAEATLAEAAARKALKSAQGPQLSAGGGMGGGINISYREDAASRQLERFEQGKESLETTTIALADLEEQGVITTKRFNEALTAARNYSIETINKKAVDDAIVSYSKGAIVLDDNTKKHREHKAALTDDQKAQIAFGKAVELATKEYQANGKAAYDAGERLKILYAVYKNITGKKFELGDDITLSPGMQRLMEDIVENQGIIEASKGRLQALGVEYGKFAKSTEDLKTKLADLNEIMRTTTDSEEYNWARKQAETIEEDLYPATVALTKKLEEYFEKVRQAQDTYARGGSEVSALEDQLTFLNDVALGMDKTSEGFKRLQRDIQDTKEKIDLANATPLELKGLDLAVEGINAFADGMAAAIEGTKSFGEVFEDFAKMMLRELAKLIIKWLIFQAISGLMGGSGGKNAGFLSKIQEGLFKADGGVFSAGREIKAFQTGGVVGGPTVFGMANGGVGVMGEAGPEAIMPLTRTSDGKLGVQAVAPVVNIHNYAGVDVRTSAGPDGSLDIELRAVEAARRAISSDIRRGGNMVSRSIEGAYGVGRGRT